MKLSIGQQVVVVFEERCGRRIDPEIVPARISKIGRRWCTVELERKWNAEYRFDQTDDRWPLDSGQFTSPGVVRVSEEVYRAEKELQQSLFALGSCWSSALSDAERWSMRMRGKLTPARIREIAGELGIADRYEAWIEKVLVKHA